MKVGTEIIKTERCKWPKILSKNLAAISSASMACSATKAMDTLWWKTTLKIFCSTYKITKRACLIQSRIKLVVHFIFFFLFCLDWWVSNRLPTEILNPRISLSMTLMKKSCRWYWQILGSSQIDFSSINHLWEQIFIWLQRFTSKWRNSKMREKEKSRSLIGK